MLISTKMAQKNESKQNKTIEIPSGIEFTVGTNEVTMKKDSKSITRKMDGCIKLSKEGNNLLLSIKSSRKSQRREFGSAKSHIKNMIEGLEKGFEYELEVCNVHFPMTVNFDKAKSEFIIKNILGEKSPRIIKVSNKIEAEIKMPKIKIKCYDLEAAGQAAANLEKISKIRYRDRNKFQDGIFITKKPGVIYS